MRKKIRKGKYVDIFALTDDLKKGRDKANKEGEVASESYRDYSLWMEGFIVFASCYLSWPMEYINVLRYMFLVT